MEVPIIVSSVPVELESIVKRDDGILLREPYRGIERAFEILANMPDDFMLERDDPTVSIRKLNCRDWDTTFTALAGRRYTFVERSPRC